MLCKEERGKRNDRGEMNKWKGIVNEKNIRWIIKEGIKREMK